MFDDAVGFFSVTPRKEKTSENACEAAGRTGTQIRPRYMVWENVPGAFSSNKGKDFQAVLQEIVIISDEDSKVPHPPKGKWQTAGCIMGDHFTIAWRVLDAQYWGVPQRRRRVYACCDTGGRSADKILFERKSHGWNFEPCIPAGQAVAGIAGDGYCWHERMVAAKPAGGGMTPPTQ